jgi:hypothetical protein
VGIAILDAARLVRTNRAQHEELEDRRIALVARSERESRAQADRRREVYDEALVPFRDLFVRLKNVDLAELSAIDLQVAGDAPTIEVVEVRLSALGAVGAMAGGLSSGVGAGAAAYAAVGAFAAASTGTPIAALSGAAATNATLAFLGGGTLAAGGGGVAAGTMVLGGLVAAPVLLAGAAFVSWKGRRERRNQREVAAELAVADAGLTLNEQRSAAVLTRSRQVRAMLKDLQGHVVDRLPAFRELIDKEADYVAYPPAARAQVATLVGLVTTTVALMATPLIDDDGKVADLSEQMLADAQQRIDDLGASGAAE